MTSLQLNRNFQNADFQSWKIGSDFVAGREVYELPANVFDGATDAVDYVHTRASVLRNHLIESQGRHFVITLGAEDTVVVNELFDCSSGSTDRAHVQFRQVAVVPKLSQDEVIGQTVEASLHSSLAVVALPAKQPAASTPSDNHSFLLVSQGAGDLFLIRQQPGADGLVSNVVYPLCPPPPAVGVKPFTIEAAWINSSGQIRCVLAAITSTQSRDSGSSSSNHQHHSNPNWVCDTWLVTLATSQQQQQALQQQQEEQQHLLVPSLQVLDCQLLLVSKSPPAAAVGTAAADDDDDGCERLLLVGEPALDDDELPTGFLAAAPATATTTEPDAAISADRLSAGAAATAAAVAADEDLDDMDIDPRTLQQAAARLAQYTAEQQLGDIPQQQWTDVFKESGPGDLGAADTEPAVDIMLFTTAAAAPPSTATAAAVQADASEHTNSSSGSLAGAKPPQLHLKTAVSCGPHRLLAVQELLQGRYNTPTGLVLGLTDDVDCALVAATLPQQQPTVAEQAATGQGAAAAGSDGSTAVVVNHDSSLPALAYVVAGKTQRRHLLLGGPLSPVAAVLVEGRQYAYLYGQVAAGSVMGQQQILNMELPTGSHILGARLIVKQSMSQLEDGGSNAAVDSEQLKGTPVSAQLLLLTQSSLIVYTLKTPK